ncbi:ArsR/SmtB family transcription factor [Archaeoglobus sp.]
MDCGEHWVQSKNFEDFRRIVRALHCPTRWLIVDCLKDGEKSTKEILECLLEKDEAITSSGLYYHLSELKNAGIVEVTGYIEQKGAPQKVWKLKTRKIVIDLVKGD